MVISRTNLVLSRTAVTILAISFAGLPSVSVNAQTTAPVLLPNTFSTVAGSSNGSAGTTGFTVGAACSPGSPYKATDIYGDGCLATQAVFGPDFQDGVHVDGQGNIWIVDYNENWSGSEVPMLRKVDAKSGVISLIMSNANNACASATATTAGAQDSNGDGCVFASAKVQKDRGYGMDPYGNFITGSYGSGYVRIACNAVSPLCPIAAGVTQTYSSAQKQVGYSYRIAGCVPSGAGGTSSATSSTAGTAGDGYFASSFWNLPGDVAAWGTSNSGFIPTFGTSAGVTGTTGTCGTTTGELNGSRGVTADQYGNVFISDGSNIRVRVVVGPPSFTLPNGTVLTNPLPAVIALNPTYGSVTAAQMYGRIYPMFGGFTATTKNANCPAGAVGGTTDEALDTYGDACPWFNSTISNGNPIGLTIDTTTEGGISSPNVVFTDASNNNLRVLYLGPTVAVGSITAAAYPMANAILINNVPTQALTQVTHGYVYLLAGNGSTTPSATTGAPVKGSAAAVGDYQRVAAGPNGNVYLSYFNGNNANIFYYDLSTGSVRELLKSSTTTTTTVNVVGGGANTSVDSCATPGAGDGTAGFSTSGAFSAAALTSSACFNGNGTGSSTLGIAVDASNNLYIADDEIDSSGYGRSRVRKVLASQLFPTTMGAPLSQTLYIHGANGTTPGTTAVAASVANSSELTVSTPACNTVATDGTVDCLATATFTPAAPGLRNATVLLSDSSLGMASAIALPGVASGSALVADSTALATAVTANIIGSGTTPVGATVDSKGDAFTMDTTAGKFTEIAGGSTVSQLAGSLPSSPTQLSLDPSGNLWAAGAGGSNTSLKELVLGSGGTYAASPVSVSISGVAEPQAVAFDVAGNLYVADLATTSVYKISAATITGTTLPALSASFPSFVPDSAVATGLSSPTCLAIDGAGNVYIADPGAGAIYRVDARSGAQTTFLSGIHPASVATDAAGNVYYQDGTTLNVVEIPLSPASTSVTVLSSLTSPTGLAVAGNGNLYSADSGAGAFKLVSRSALTYNFGTTTGTTFGATVTNAGNLAATGYAVTNSTEFPISSGTTNGCGTVPSTSNPLAVGAACALTSTFLPATTGGATTTSTNSLLAAASTSGSFVLKGVEPAGISPIATTTITGGPANNTAPYAASGTEFTYTINVTASDGSTVTGYVNVSIDSGSPVQYTLTAGKTATVSVPISGLIAASHTLTAVYPSGQADLQSNTASQAFTITPEVTTIQWTPSATTQQYSAAIGLGVLDATATAGGANIPGAVIYQATNSSTNASVYVHSASFLPIGTYTLTATFVPNDSIDYAGSTATISTYSVTKATTTAGIGATQNLIAADGTGNYTSVQSALNALPTTGGQVYIKPGTYTGFVSLNIPNTSIYGLGGDPTKVVVTNEWGAFSPPYLAGQGPGNNGQTGNPGSSTFYIARSTVNSYSGIPANIYIDNISINNTWDLDTTNLDYNHYIGSGGNANGCATESTGYSNFVLFEGGGSESSPGLCGGQALALYVTSDMTVFNNVYTTSGQDTFFSGAQGTNASGGGNPARQYFFRGFISGVVDYLWGDSALVMDYTSVYASTRGGTSFEAQNKRFQTGSSGDYLSGYVMNNAVFTSASSAQTMTYGRPYGMYSTYIMLNSYVDQVIAAGWTEFSGDTNLPTSTYDEYNTIAYTDPATGAADLNGVIYNGSGGSSGSGVTGTRETTSQSPGTPMANNTVKTSMTLVQAQAYFPTNFLSTTVPVSSLNAVTNWIPTTALANGVNAFATGAKASSVAAGTSVTILLRPQTPGLGAITNGSYTIPTGTYTLTDTVGGNASTLASGTLDASGEAYFISSNLAIGTHNLTWSYSGDANFSGSTTASAYVLTVSGTNTVTALGATTNPITYGQSAQITATVSPAAGTVTPTGTVTLTIDGVSTMSASLSSGQTIFTVNGLPAGAHSFTASYGGAATFNSSTTSSALSLQVNQATLTAKGSCSNRIFDQPNVCSAAVTGYQYSDTAATVFSGTPAGTTTATRVSPSGTYSGIPLASSLALTTFGTANYTVASVGSNFTVAGGAPQTIIFAPLPNFTHGATYQLTARTTSGLPATYTVTGNASISGAMLNVTGTGPITVTAMQTTDPTGDYAAATAVSRSFTAQ